ncbi:MAG TPA: hypothetical protein VFI01_01960 [Gaiellaceae bacterium]|nr:hypothetical protein [Gaiellaceae bacterium]
MLVPVPVQDEIAAKAPLVAYAPSRLAPGWRYVRWTHQGPLRIWFDNRAGREIVFIAARFSGNCRAGMEKSFQMAGVKVYWGDTSNGQEAWRCVNGMKLVGATSLAPDRFADVGLARLVASGHRLRR